MNLYFLVEGKRTEPRIYPKWLKLLLPNFTKTERPFDLKNTNTNFKYFIFSGCGYPSLLNHIENSILDINDIGKFSYFIICVDSEEVCPKKRKQEIIDHIEEKGLVLDNTELVIIVQNICIETWLLGNEKVFLSNPTDKTYSKEYIKKYNVQDNDPELMPSFSKEKNTAQYHLQYLKYMLIERNMKYSKNNVQDVGCSDYLSALICRSTKTNHLKSFGEFYSLCEKIKRESI